MQRLALLKLTVVLSVVLRGVKAFITLIVVKVLLDLVLECLDCEVVGFRDFARKCSGGILDQILS